MHFAVYVVFFGQGHGRIDEPRGSRLLLKDFVSGKLLYCHPPPGFTSADAAEGDDEEVQMEDDEENDIENDPMVTEATDLSKFTELPIQSEDQVLFDTERELATLGNVETGPSRRLAKHGRKHKKARDKDPYSHGTTAFVAKLKGKNGTEGSTFTRKSGFT